MAKIISDVKGSNESFDCFLFQIATAFMEIKRTEQDEKAFSKS